MLLKAIPEKRPTGEESVSPNFDTSETPKYDMEQDTGSALEDEEWAADHASMDEMSLQASPTQFSEETMEMLWPGFAAGMQTQQQALSQSQQQQGAYKYATLMDPSGQEQIHQHDGFSLQPFMGIGEGFEDETIAAYQPQYGVSGTGMNVES